MHTWAPTCRHKGLGPNEGAAPLHSRRGPLKPVLGALLRGPDELLHLPRRGRHEARSHTACRSRSKGHYQVAGPHRVPMGEPVLSCCACVWLRLWGIRFLKGKNTLKQSSWAWEGASNGTSSVLISDPRSLVQGGQTLQPTCLEAAPSLEGRSQEPVHHLLLPTQPLTLQCRAVGAPLPGRPLSSTEGKGQKPLCPLAWSQSSHSPWPLVLGAPSDPVILDNPCPLRSWCLRG